MKPKNKLLDDTDYSDYSETNENELEINAPFDSNLISTSSSDRASNIRNRRSQKIKSTVIAIPNKSTSDFVDESIVASDTLELMESNDLVEPSPSAEAITASEITSASGPFDAAMTINDVVATSSFVTNFTNDEVAPTNSFFSTLTTEESVDINIVDSNNNNVDKVSNLDVNNILENGNSTLETESDDVNNFRHSLPNGQAAISLLATVKQKEHELTSILGQLYFNIENQIQSESDSSHVSEFF
jgi:hypothetical protein